MIKIEIVDSSLQISSETKKILVFPKLYAGFTSLLLYENVPIISLFNINVGTNLTIFQQPLSNCEDGNGVAFTADSFIAFAEANLGFNQSGISQTILLSNDYSTLPNPTTVVGKFYWCQFPKNNYLTGLYYSNGVSWEFNQADDITVVANYSALPLPNTAINQFFWCETPQGTKYSPTSVGGDYYSAGLYYSNGSSWTFLETPYQATQNEVNTGVNSNKFVTPNTLFNSTKWGTKFDVPTGTSAQYIQGNGDLDTFPIKYWSSITDSIEVSTNSTTDEVVIGEATRFHFCDRTIVKK
jgi:hypothetical protein